MIRFHFCALSLTSSVRCSIAFLLVLSGLLVGLNCANEEGKGIFDSLQLQITSGVGGLSTDAQGIFVDSLQSNNKALEELLASGDHPTSVRNRREIVSFD